MIPLSLANILHHKVRSLLSAAGVAIGVCMLLTLSGLSRGTLQEIADRWNAVDADLIVYPRHWGSNITTIEGGGLGLRDVEHTAGVTVGGARAVERVVPVFLYRFSIAGHENNVAGVAPEQLLGLLGGRDIVAGRLYDPQGRFARWLRHRLRRGGEDPVDVSEAELAAHGGLEMVVDTRLARAADLEVGSRVLAAGHHFTVVGIVRAGALARAFVPRATAEFLCNGPLDRFTLMFVKLREDVAHGAAAEAIRRHKRLAAVAVGQYEAMLEERFGILYRYVDAVNGVTLVVAFLSILVALYTMVIQRTREIAILKSLGATRWFMLREVLAESLILSICGAGLGAAAAPLAGAVIQAAAPLLTVDVAWPWVAVAAGAALAGGCLGALYPAWCALRVDTVEALALE